MNTLVTLVLGGDGFLACGLDLCFNNCFLLRNIAHAVIACYVLCHFTCSFRFVFLDVTNRF